MYIFCKEEIIFQTMTAFFQTRTYKNPCWMGFSHIRSMYDSVSLYFSYAQEEMEAAKKKHKSKNITNANMKTNRSRVARQRRKYLLKMLRRHSANSKRKGHRRQDNKRYLLKEWNGCGRKDNKKYV